MMKIFVEDKISASHCKKSASWKYIRKNFADDFFTLESSGKLTLSESSEILWQTRNKYVLKVPLPSGTGSVVLKSFRHIPKWDRYFLRRSPAGNEALNYQMLSDAGMPMAEMIAAGDTRQWGLLKNTFLITMFAENFSDGRDFITGGALLHRHEMRDEFIRGNLKLLAQLHNSGIIHRGFTPANLLYRKNVQHMEFCWIDVASCRKPWFMSVRQMAEDLATFFRYFDLTPQTRRELLRSYLDIVSRKINSGKLLQLIERRIAAGR